MQTAAQLANLKPAWKKGESPSADRGRRSKAVAHASTELRSWSPRAVAFLGAVMEDNEQAMSDRVRAAIAILDKIIPNASAKDNPSLLTAENVTSITLSIVRCEPAPPTIDAEPEPEEPLRQLLTIATRCAGESD